MLPIVLAVFLLAHASVGSAATTAEKKSTEIIQMVLLKLHRKGKTSVVEYLIDLARSDDVGTLLVSVFSI